MTKEEVAEYWRTAYCNEKHKKEELEKQLAISELDREHNDYELTEVYKKVAELEAQIEKMKAELHHRLVSPSHGDSDCLDKIIGLDRLWQFGEEF